MSEELETKLDFELDEAKATGEDSVAADAVAPAGGAVKKRKGDVKKSVNPTADKVVDDGPSKGPNDTGLKEAFEGLFEDTDLSEEFKTKVTAVFEASVHEKVLAEKATLEEKFESDLEEQVATVTEELVEKVDTYLDYVVEQWMEANEVAIESGIKVEVAESLLDSLKGLVSEHNLSVDEAELDIVSEAEERADAATAKYNEVVEEMIAIKEAKQALELKIAFKEVAEGLVATHSEKLAVLAEGATFETVDEYKAKLIAIKESYFAESVNTPEDQTEFLEEEVETAEVKATDTDPSVAAYAASIGRLAK